jgi:hypothetical protein
MPISTQRHVTGALKHDNARTERRALCGNQAAVQRTVRFLNDLLERPN